MYKSKYKCTTVTEGILPQAHPDLFAKPPAHWNQTLLTKILCGSMS